MAHVLPVPALQLGDPLALVVLMETHDSPLHRLPTRSVQATATVQEHLLDPLSASLGHQKTISTFPSFHISSVLS